MKNPFVLSLVQKLSFFEVASTPLFVSLLVYTGQNARFLDPRIAAALFCIFTSLGIVFFFADFFPCARTGACFFLSLGLGFFLLVMHSAGVRMQLPKYPVKTDRITAFRGRLLRDGITLAGGRTLHTLLVLSVVTKDDWQFDTRFQLAVIGKTERVYHWGRLVSFTGHLPTGDRADTGLCFIDNGGMSVEGWAGDWYRWRSLLLRRVVEKIEVLPPQSEAFLKTLFLGIREDPAAPELIAFRQSGCAHILALSGMHLGILTVMMSLALRPLLGRYRAGLLCLILSFGYVFLAGPRPSLVRSLTMAACTLFNRRSGTGFSVFKRLCFAFLLLSLLMPTETLSLSFKLSFAALSGMLLIGQGISQRLRTWLPGWLALPFGASIGAQCATAPLLIASFGALYPVGILATLIVTPLVTLFLWLGVLYLVLPGPSDFSLLAVMIDGIYRVTLWTVRLFSLFPGITFSRQQVFSNGCALVLIVLFLCYAGWYETHKLRFGKGDIKPP